MLDNMSRTRRGYNGRVRREEAEEDHEDDGEEENEDDWEEWWRCFGDEGEQV